VRTFLAFVIVLCLIGGLYLLQGPDFYWPDRRDPSYAAYLSGTASRLLGLALLLIAGLGVMAAHQASRATGRAAPRGWQIRFFVLTMLALALIATAFQMSEYGTNPESRRHAETQR
jgi:hypothetical protein